MKKLLVLIICSFSIISSSLSEAFYIKNYQVEITLSSEGYFDVTEDIMVFFTENRRGIIREISDSYVVDGKRYHVEITNIQVDKWNYNIQSGRGTKNIRIGDADITLSGDQKYRIHYRVERAFLVLDTHDEFYWNFIGTDWDVPIEHSSFTVRYPHEWNDEILGYKAFSGEAGSVNSEIYLTMTPGQISGASSVRLEPGHGITLAIKFSKNLITKWVPSPPSSRDKEQGETIDSVETRKKSPRWFALLPAGLLLLLFTQWKRIGRAEEESKLPTEIFFPPRDMSPAEVGTFYDFKVNRRDIISLLPFWGQMGLLKMTPLPDDENDFHFQKLNEIPDDRPDYEKEYFNALFTTGDLVLMSNLKKKFYKTMHSVSRKIKKEVMDQNLYDKKSIRIFHSGWMIAAFILLLALGILSFIVFNAIMAGIGFIITGIFALVLHFITPRHSEKGRFLHENLVALYHFLKSPDPDKLSELMDSDPHYLNKLFPYALAFGLDKEWASRFVDLFVSPPEWYDDPRLYGAGSMYNFGQFASNFQPHTIEQVFYSAPVDTGSSSGSFSGGGFSGGNVGGGFGGGGGSSW